ncbi:protein kinase [Trichophyton violaceum]|uniref:Protein kinase n=1 Tax=Trichophyton violaceum TaxID=34388 RepID=A0A178FBS4_TRIVO|nr:protein kinase [Trichophyton violaceum]
MTVGRLLFALEFLHTEAEIIHADLKTDNVMLSLEDTTILRDFMKSEAESPSPREKIDESRIVYQSREFEGKGYGLLVLCGSGEARIGKRHKSGPFVQPNTYKAPEIIFEMPCGSALDIWNLAGLLRTAPVYLSCCIIWDPFKHLALMVALIGPPPSEFVRRSEATEQCFGPGGLWIAHEHAAIPPVSLEGREGRLSGQEKESFIRSMGSMLKWPPEEHSTAKQLLEGPWFDTF